MNATIELSYRLLLYSKMKRIILIGALSGLYFAVSTVKMDHSEYFPQVALSCLNIPQKKTVCSSVGIFFFLFVWRTMSVKLSRKRPEKTLIFA